MYHAITIHSSFTILHTFSYIVKHVCTQAPSVAPNVLLWLLEVWWGGGGDGVGKHPCQEDPWKGKAVLKSTNGQEVGVVILSGDLHVQGDRLSPMSGLGKQSDRHHLMEATVWALGELEEFHLRDQPEEDRGPGLCGHTHFSAMKTLGQTSSTSFRGAS